MSQSDGARVARAIRYLDEHVHDQPELAEVAAAVQLSEYHFQRLFRRWAGVSPKRFLQFLTAEHARRVLASSASVLDAALESGLSGPGRLHDLTINVHAMSPGEVRRRGEGLVVRYGFQTSPFGECLLGSTDRGICALGFVATGGRDATLDDLRGRWPRAIWQRDDEVTRRLADRVFYLAPAQGDPALALHVHGTNFQVRVWEALLRVPEGALVTYGDLARAVGDPRASRAVGSAVGANPISYLIPCHRVIRSTGVVGNYRWGSTTKKALIGWESARRISGDAASP
jgi:AraC family transcriptional regulator, regulatory protein of adaptative response / methylated-DNA-[protein]-cysteine methyltransferase